MSRKLWPLGHISAVAVLPPPKLLRRTLAELPTSNIAALGAYLLVVVALLLSVDAPASTPHFADDVAFRAAWVTVIQIPLVFFLSTKRGPINILASISYENILYLHKWAGRMIFISATTHFAIMKSSISVADIVLSQNAGATVVRYGIGSYLLLAWIALSSVLPIRKWSYRAFFINHWTSTLFFLMLTLKHVPKHALIPICMAVGLVTIDRISTLSLFAKTNISVRPLKLRLAKFRRGAGRSTLIAGYPVEMSEPHILSVSAGFEQSATIIRICNVPMKWRPGQHIRVYLPALGAFEVHPFTPANCSNIQAPPPLPPRGSGDLEGRGSSASTIFSRQSSDIVLMIRAHSGLTRRLKEFHTEWLKLPCPNATDSATATALTAHVDGPYGSPPRWEDYETIILVVSSTGVSFALSIVDYLEQLCLSNLSLFRTRVVRFVWIIRHIDPQLEAAVAELLRRYSTILKDSGVQMETELHVTCMDAEINLSILEVDQFAHLRPRLPRYGSGDRSLTIRNPDEIYDEWEEEERQWAEMEALEDMKMKEIDPFEDSSETSSVYDIGDIIADGHEGDGYANSETSTLLNGVDGRQQHQSGNSLFELPPDADSTSTQSQARSLSSPIYSPLLPRHILPEKHKCECAVVQYERRKLHGSGRSSFDNCSYGRRPDISGIVTSALNSNQHSRPIVAVCANNSLSRHVRTAVSHAKLAFARGQRATDVAIFNEGFS